MLLGLWLILIFRATTLELRPKPLLVTNQKPHHLLLPCKLPERRWGKMDPISQITVKKL